MDDPATVLVVDDEPAIIRVVTAALGARGYRVLSATTGQEALAVVASLAPSVVVLDLRLPDIDGIEVCRRIRAWSDVPIIVLTAEGADNSKVAALDEGADDYVTKPFSVPELLARVRVAIRHRRPADEPADTSILTVGDLRIDLSQRLVSVGARPVELTPKEFGFLAVLARHPGRVITHRLILERVWGPGYASETQYLRVYASQLRKKLQDGPMSRRLITAPGVGYRLVDPTEEPTRPA